MEEEQEFIKNKFVFGLIIKASLEDINGIKKYIASNTNSYVVYQKISTSKLWIKEGNENEARKDKKN